MKRQRVVWVVVCAALVVLVVVLRGRIQFDWGMFWRQLRHVRPGPIALGIGLIYATYWMRAWRWAVLVRPVKRIGTFSTVGSQFIGFTAVGLFGRLADLTRPYLIAKRVELSLGSQVAVYTIERMFDLGAAAIIFSTALAFTPRSLPHHEVFVRTGLFSLAGTAFLAVFALVVRAWGLAVAGVVRRVFGRLSEGAAEGVAGKIVEFREGLMGLSGVGQLALTLAISLGTWAMIGMAYVETLHAFAETPELATISFARTMLLMGASIGGSLLQLPVLGWFTQIAVTAAAMRTFYGAPVESATACGALLLIVTSLSILPMGFVFAQVERVSVRSAAEASEAAAGAVDQAAMERL
jgi:glycosyltransferase 2 family protein